MTHIQTVFLAGTLGLTVIAVIVFIVSEIMDVDEGLFATLDLVVAALLLALGILFSIMAGW